MQVTFNCDPSLVPKIDDAAKERLVSRSRFIVECINTYFAPNPPSSNEVELLKKDIAHLNDKLVDRDNTIAEQKEAYGRLWLEWKEANDKLTRYQLPPPTPKKSWWDRLRRR